MKKIEKNDAKTQEEVWNQIAKKWSEYRQEPFDDVKKFLKGKKGKILDLACGSGRNFGIIEGEITGVDFSSEMIKLASERAEKLGKRINLVKSNASELPFNDEEFDYAVFMAGLHCIDDEGMREKAVKELYRVLKKGGEAYLSVWSSGHERIKGKGKEQMLPWGVEGEKLMRYYYIYSKDELKVLLEKTGFDIISIEEEENIVAIIKK